MKFLALAYGNFDKMMALSESEMAALGGRCKPYDEDLRRSAKPIVNEGLEWAATSIRPRNGKVVVTDGPFLETKDQVGGVFLIEAKDLAEAVALASKHPAAHLGENLGWGIELRPVAVFE